jgi:aspartate dehydrogenase
MTAVGIIGCGNVGTELVRACPRGATSFQVFDTDAEKSHQLTELRSRVPVTVCSSIGEVFRCADMVVEAAGVAAVGEVLDTLQVHPRTPTVILSVGGLIIHFPRYRTLLARGSRITIPSGAIAGCDALSALRRVPIRSITLRTSKPAATLVSAPYFRARPQLGRSLKSKDRVVVFRGGVREAIRHFPQNINVAATLAVVSGRPDLVRVEIVADRTLTRNVHEVTVVSEAGTLYTRTENAPSPSNPKTSYLAALSLVAAVEDLLGRR